MLSICPVYTKLWGSSNQYRCIIFCQYMLTCKARLRELFYMKYLFECFLQPCSCFLVTKIDLHCLIACDAGLNNMIWVFSTTLTLFWGQFFFFSAPDSAKSSLNPLVHLLSADHHLLSNDITITWPSSQTQTLSALHCCSVQTKSQTPLSGHVQEQDH